MGCGASKVDPSIQSNVVDPNKKPTQANGVAEVNNNKTKSLESVRPSSRSKLLSGRPSSASGSIKLTDTPNKGAKKSLARDSNGSIRAQSSTSINSEVERNFSENLVKTNSRAELFAAKPQTPIKSSDHSMKPKPLAFVVSLDSKSTTGKPPRRLESLANTPKLQTEQEIKEKIRKKTEKRELELERKKLKSSRMSRRKRELIQAREQSKLQDQADELETKMQSSGNNLERIKAERIEKLRKRKEHAQKVRERAQRLKAGEEEFDEGLGGELETYKSKSDDESENIWSSKDDEIHDKPGSVKSKNSRVSLNTLDSGVSKLKDDVVDEFYNA